MLLIGDVGGTKTAIAIVSRESGPRAFLEEAVFPSERYSSLEAIVDEFLKDKKIIIDRAVFGVAGPVIGGKAQLTNLPWMVDQYQLKETFCLSSVHLLNDLAALAHAVPHLEPSELVTINEGHTEEKGNIAVVAPGTGLGEAFLVWTGERYTVHSSEGGHADFAPQSPLEMELLAYLREKLDHVSFERVCSGPGIANIYSFLKDRGYGSEPDWFAERIRGVADPTPEIVRGAFEGGHSCELCVKALDMFVSLLGAEVGNMALKVMATRGVYLGGGIPPRIVPFFEKDIFMNSFRRKGRYAGVMERIPVYVILNTKVALLGAACAALECQ